jgi:hypothetical protein
MEGAISGSFHYFMSTDRLAFLFIHNESVSLKFLILPYNKSNHIAADIDVEESKNIRRP